MSTASLKDMLVAFFRASLRDKEVIKLLMTPQVQTEVRATRSQMLRLYWRTCSRRSSDGHVTLI